MAKAPLYEERAAVQAADFRIPAQARQAQSYDRLQQALGRWQEVAQQEVEAEAAQAMAQRATLEQAEMAPGELAAPPEDVARRFQEAYRRRAYVLFDQQLTLDATRNAFELRLEYENDPEGFATAWAAYVDGQEETTAKTDPAAAAAARQSLEAFGNETFQKLAEAAHIRDRKAQVADAIETMEAQRGLWSDIVKVSGEEEDYTSGLAHLDAMVEDYLALGLFSTADYHEWRDNNSRVLTTDYLRGRFRGRLQADDTGGAETVITLLREGKWFRDNEEGEQLANSLASELAAHLKAAEGEQETSVELAMHRLRRMTSAQLTGQEISEEDFFSDVRFVLKNGNPAQQHKAHEFIGSYQYGAELGGRVAQLPYYALGDVLEQVDKTQLGQNREAYDALRGQLERQKKDIEQGIRNGDYIPESLTFTDITLVTPEQVQARRTQASNLSGVPLRAVPVWSNAETAQFARRIEAGLVDQRGDEVDALLSSYVAGYDGDLAAAARGALRLGESAPAVYLPAVIHAIAPGQEPDLVTDALSLAGSGRRADRAAVLNQRGADVADVRSNTEVQRAVKAASLSDPNVAEDMLSFLEDVYVGRLAQDPEASRRKALNEVKRVLSPFRHQVEFDNGAVLPAALVAGDPTSAAEVTSAVNAYLADPRKFNAGYDFQPREDFLRHVAIQPAPGGGLGFFHTTHGAFLRDTDGDIVSVETSETEGEVGFTPDPSGVMRAIAPALEWAGKQAERAIAATDAARLRQAATALGANPSLLEGVYYAVQDASPQDLGWRPALGLPEDIDRRIDVGAIQREMEQAYVGAPQHIRPERVTVDDATARPYVAAQHLARMAELFPNDTNAQLAAYFDSPEAVKKLQKEHGRRWFAHLPVATSSFVHSAQRYAARRRTDG